MSSARSCRLAAALGVFCGASSLCAQPADPLATTVKDLAGKIARAVTPKDIIEARKAMLKNYAFRVTQGQGPKYAKLATDALGGMLDNPDPVKQINAAMVLSRMSQAEIRPALDIMIAHANPAVRYLGWRGYRDAQRVILMAGEAPADAMFAAIDRRITAERSPIVIKVMIQALRFPAQGGLVSPGVFKKAHQQSVQALLAGWVSWCQDILEPSATVVEIAPNIVETIVLALAKLEPAQVKKLQGQVLQRVYDMMQCGSKVYVERAKQPDSLTAALAGLLGSCEKGLADVSGKASERVRDALKKKSEPEMVAIKIIDWQQELKLQETKIAKRVKAAPATQPTTKPTTQPTTKPAKATTKPTTKPTTRPTTKPAPKTPKTP